MLFALPVSVFMFWLSGVLALLHPGQNLCLNIAHGPEHFLPLRIATSNIIKASVLYRAAHIKCGQNMFEGSSSTQLVGFRKLQTLAVDPNFAVGRLWGAIQRLTDKLKFQHYLFDCCV